MKALTVQQPWAWAIIHGSKNIENRTQLWKYRGPLAIHAGSRWSPRGAVTVPEIAGRGWQQGWDDKVDRVPAGVIIGVVDLVDVHDGFMRCCQPWGEGGVGPSGYGITHLVLENPRPVEPIPYKGRLGLWNLPDDIAARLT